MDLAKILVEELGWQGSQGCSLNELWALVQDRLPDCQLIQDLDLQYFCWKNYLVPRFRSGAIQFHLPAHLATVDSILAWDREGLRAYADDVLIRLDKVLSKNQLLTSQSGHSITLSDSAYDLIERIARCRWHGVSQPDLSKHGPLDARSVFHYLKECRGAGLVTKRYMISDKGFTLVFWLHVHFVSRRSLVNGSEDDRNVWVNPSAELNYRVHISDTLTAAKNQTMTIYDLRETVGLHQTHRNRRHFIELLNQLTRCGVLERVHVIYEKQALDAVRLVKPFTNPEVAEQPAVLSHRSLYAVGWKEQVSFMVEKV